MNYDQYKRLIRIDFTVTCNTILLVIILSILLTYIVF
jgi:hypothetical protein